MNFKVRQDPCCCFPCLLGSPYQPLVTARLNLLISCVAMIGSQCFLLLGLARPVRAFPVGFQRELIRIPQPVPATWCKSCFLFGQLRGKSLVECKFPLHTHSRSSSLRAEMQGGKRLGWGQEEWKKLQLPCRHSISISSRLCVWPCSFPYCCKLGN